MKNRKSNKVALFKRYERNQKGITLIALIITIIVMLILVAVTVRTAVNSGLFGHAKDATDKWGDAQKKEGEIGNDNTISDYVNKYKNKNGKYVLSLEGLGSENYRYMSLSLNRRGLHPRISHRVISGI